MATYPLVLPVAEDPTVDPNGIGRDDKVASGVPKPRESSLYADELVQIIKNVVAIAAKFGLPDGSTSGSVWQALVGMGSQLSTLIADVGSGKLSNAGDYQSVTGADTINATARLVVASGASYTLQLPALASITKRRTIVLINTGSGTVTLARNGASQINDQSASYPVTAPGFSSTNNGARFVLIDLDPGGFHYIAALPSMEEALVDSDFAGAALGELTRTGTGTYAVLKHNRGATVAPTTGDNFAAGYAIGSQWIDTVAKHHYVCVGNGEWVQTDSGGLGGLLTTVASTVALYNFDGNLNDSSGNGRNLSLIGSIAYVSDIKKNAAFGALGTGGASSANAGLRIVTSMTIELVVSGFDKSAGLQWLLAHGTYPQRRYVVGFDSGGALFTQFDKSSTAYSCALPTAVDKNRRYYLAITREVSGGNTTLLMYVDGALKATAVHTGLTPDDSGGNTTMYVAQNSGDGERLTNSNMISQLHICTAVLTAAEIAARAKTLGLWNP